jgi:hypothetical protein
VHLANYLGYLHQAGLDLAEGFRKVGEAHAAEVDVYHTCITLAKQCEAHAEQLRPFVDRYGEEKPDGVNPIFRTVPVVNFRPSGHVWPRILPVADTRGWSAISSRCRPPL